MITGYSVALVIDPNIGEERVYEFKGIKEFLTHSQKDFDFVDGHFPYGIHLLTKKPCVYYTILREPLDHAISYYHFIRQCDYQNYKHPKLDEAKRLNLIEFTDINRNLQCVTLAGFPWNRLYDRGSRRILELARKHLFQSCCHFGILEKLEVFEEEISSIFDWTYEPIYEQSKVTKKRPRVADLSSAERESLTEILSHDIELYSEARSRIEEGRTKSA